MCTGCICQGGVQSSGYSENERRVNSKNIRADDAKPTNRQNLPKKEFNS